MNFNPRLKTHIYIKLVFFVIIGLFSLKLVNTNNSTDAQIINSPNSATVVENGFQEVITKMDKQNNKIIIDGVTYDLKNPNGVHIEVAGYKTMQTNEIIMSLIYILSKNSHILFKFK